ncbi:hypothetical protein M2360_003185 [Rhizobium sp. SG_E_25_P2]|uniref:hypothetical protein n=1 Tax=Rhizobium sp. SG_E_25_P2 TaxID=2879942 RepID=UPI0024749F13|nr:hypothetical protein [Rhizobium sp. SG_E_25_P2]MDH6267785.1 hypothetical protein [Rhizobium sp. SG_E_25_P2]
MNHFNGQHEAAGCQDDLAGARTLVIRFLADLRDRPIGSDILDANELPASRSVMIEAFRMLVENEPRRRIRDQLIMVGLLLSQYQQGVGDRLKVQAAPAPGLSKQEAEPPHIPAVRRIERALSAVDPDRLRLMRLFEQASMRAMSKPVQKRAAQARQSDDPGSGKGGWMAR